MRKTKDRDKDFQSLALRLISKNIPKAFIEGYDWTLKQVDKSNVYPKHLKSILVGTDIYTDDCLKVYIGSKLEQKIPILINQHGGGYGICDFFFNEYYETSIADKFISWGWKDSSKSNIKALGIPPSFVSSKTKSRLKDKILMFTVCYPRYSYKIASVPIAGQWDSYFEGMCTFFKSIEYSVKKYFCKSL